MQPAIAAEGAANGHILLQAQPSGPQQAEGKQQQHEQQPRQPAVVLGDGVQEFSEIAVAAGALGRFPGSGIMPLIRQFVGLEAVS